MKTKSGIFSICAVLICMTTNPFSANSQSANNQAVATIEYSGDALAYNTYCLIGALNDGYWTSTWTKETTLNWLDYQISTLGDAEVQYHGFLGSGFAMNSTDSSYINDLSYEFTYLKLEARALQDYINNPNDDTRKIYLDARDDAWEWLNLIDFGLYGKN